MSPFFRRLWLVPLVFAAALVVYVGSAVILGLWLEDEALGNDTAFVDALARAFARFTAFLGARAGRDGDP
jgi:hypothetical protein